MYRIIEHFALGRRRIELFGEDHNIRTGWLTVEKRDYARRTSMLSRYRKATKSPMKNQQQMQQSNSISLSTTSSGSRRAAGNSPQNPTAFILNQEASTSTNPGASPMEGFRGPAEHAFDMFEYKMQSMQPNGEYVGFESQRMMNVM